MNEVHEQQPIRRYLTLVVLCGLIGMYLTVGSAVVMVLIVTDWFNPSIISAPPLWQELGKGTLPLAAGVGFLMASERFWKGRLRQGSWLGVLSLAGVVGGIYMELNQ